MIKFFIYCRKSSEDEDRQLLSIDAQYAELNQLAAEHALHIVGKFDESKSAKEPGREVFNEMLRRIEKGEANGILCWALHRIARNFDDGGRIIGLLQRGVIQEIRTFERVYLPSDNVIMMALEFGIANQYVRDLSRDVRRGIREKLRRGEFCGKAPLGYFNHPKSRTIEPHAQHFPKVKRILEMFATAEFTLTGIQKEFTRAGLVGAKSKKPMPLSSIGQILCNPFYYGAFLHKGELHEGSHVPMISKQTFDDIQRALVAVGKPRQRRGEKGFAFLDFATCGCCGYAITAERHIKKSGLRFHYYHCTHKRKSRPCNDRTYVREEKFSKEVKRNVELVTISDEWKERFLAKIETWEDEGSKSKQERITALRAEQVCESKARPIEQRVPIRLVDKTDLQDPPQGDVHLLMSEVFLERSGQHLAVAQRGIERLRGLAAEQSRHACPAEASQSLPENALSPAQQPTVQSGWRLFLSRWWSYLCSGSGETQ